MLLLAALTLGFAPVPFPKPRPETKVELNKLQGEWVQTGQAFGPGPVRPDRGGGAAVFTGDKLSFRRNGVESVRWTIVLGPRKAPTQIDLRSPVTPRGPARPDEFILGLYHLEGDRLTTVFRNATNVLERPTAINPRAGWIVAVYERKKP